jgi:alpha-L-arabinofuranosidase
MASEPHPTNLWKANPHPDGRFSAYRRLSTAFAVWCVGAVVVHGQTTDASCTVEVSRPGAAVAPICRGQQIEEFNHQFEGGLYAQLINNPSFKELSNPSTGWFF